MIKILHFGLSSELGGIETYLYKLTKFIDKKQFQFDFLIYGNEKPVFYKELTEMGCNFIFVPSRRENPLKNLTEINKILRVNNYDIFHCHLVSLKNTSHILTAIKNKLPTIVHSHSSNNSSNLSFEIETKIKRMLLPKNKITPISVSTEAAQWIFNDTKTMIINNGIDINKYAFNSEDRKRYRDKMNLHNKFVLIHVGRMVEVKNHKFILEIFNQLLKINNNCELLLIGPGGPMKQDISKKVSDLMIENKVRFLGPRQDIPELYSASDALIFPSFFEGFPGVVLEAQTSGLVSLISESITKEVIINDNCKSLSLEESPLKWAEELRSIVPMENRGLGSINIKKAGLSVEDEIFLLEEQYKKILK